MAPPGCLCRRFYSERASPIRSVDFCLFAPLGRGHVRATESGSSVPFELGVSSRRKLWAPSLNPRTQGRRKIENSRECVSVCGSAVMADDTAPLFASLNRSSSLVACTQQEPANGAIGRRAVGSFIVRLIPGPSSSISLSLPPCFLSTPPDTPCREFYAFWPKGKKIINRCR